MENNNGIIPVILGADLGAYSAARAFFEHTGENSYLFARARLAISDGAEFTRTIAIKDFDECNVAVPALITFAKAQAPRRLILVPVADWYMQMTEYARDTLRGYFFFNLPRFEIWRAVSDKLSFYKLLSKFGIPAPRSLQISLSDTSAVDQLSSPYVLKPADSTEYWKHKFDGMQKVYFPRDKERIGDILSEIEGAGYGGRIILQERIGDLSDKPHSSVFTTYSDKNGKVRACVFARVLVEEQGRTSKGNYAALVTDRPTAICNSIVNMLNSIGYTGFANFDILTLGDKEYCLELNARPGRSCDHLRAAGMNIAELLLCDLNGSEFPKYEQREIFWRCLPLAAVKKLADDEALLRRALSIADAGGEHTPHKGLEGQSVSRKVYLFVHGLKRGIVSMRDSARAAEGKI